MFHESRALQMLCYVKLETLIQQRAAKDIKFTGREKGSEVQNLLKFDKRNPGRRGESG